MKCSILVLTVLSTCAVFAQEKRPSPNQRIIHFLSRPGVAESIGVPKEKIEIIKKQLEPIQTEQIRLVEEIRGKIRANYEEASDILTKPEADPAKLIAQAEETGRIHTQIAVLDIKKLVVIRDNLTPEQTKALLTKMKESMPQNRSGKKEPRRQPGQGDEQGRGERRPNGDTPPPNDGPNPDGQPPRDGPNPDGPPPNDPR